MTVSPNHARIAQEALKQAALVITGKKHLADAAVAVMKAAAKYA